MTTSSPTAPMRKLYDQFMAGNQEAFALTEFDVAYHALMAALHCAQTLKDAQSLQEIERVAYAQLAEIDTRYPAYAHSTPSAAKRGHVSIFTTLAHQAKARIQMADHEARASSPKDPLSTS